MNSSYANRSRQYYGLNPLDLDFKFVSARAYVRAYASLHYGGGGQCPAFRVNVRVQSQNFADAGFVVRVNSLSRDLHLYEYVSYYTLSATINLQG
jgi:hypothetical protein